MDGEHGDIGAVGGSVGVLFADDGGDGVRWVGRVGLPEGVEREGKLELTREETWIDEGRDGRRRQVVA